MDLLIKFVKMHPLIQLLSSELVAIIKRIGNGSCDISDVDDMNEVITALRKTTHTLKIFKTEEIKFAIILQR